MKLQIEDIHDLEPIDKVIIHSLDWMLYQVTVESEGQERPLYQGDSPFKSRSLLEIQEIFQFVDVEHYTLRRPNSAYDEMVGQPPSFFPDSFKPPLPWKQIADTRH
ncbi:DUF6482 family protein [Neptuniibacter sp. QD37_6]|uniref:DUF6482 family protein n=1 Tax=Neptuniibacter sp. QD37_6 TaxID=3398210 RepID=UPI0039F4B3AB